MTNQQGKEREEQGIEKREATLPQGVELTSERRQFLPAVDIHETNDTVVIVADMPGVGKGQVDITLEKNILTLHGKVQSEELEDLRRVFAESEIGDFHRSFSVPEEIDQERIDANLTHGVLTVTLPKATPTRKRIEVKTI